MWTSCGTQRVAGQRTSASSGAGPVAYFALDAPDFQEAGELKGDALARALRVLDARGAPSANANET